jgi:outer membrane protein assembly factor BamB
MRVAIALALFLGIAASATGLTHYVKWNHANGRGDDRNVAAIDLESGKVVWEKKLRKEVNFVLETKEGILVGSDDGFLYLLRPSDGSQIWGSNLGVEVNEFHRDAGDAFLVSHDKQVYWLVDREGKVRASWK